MPIHSLRFAPDIQFRTAGTLIDGVFDVPRAIHHPILRGFNPDPSIVRVGESVRAVRDRMSGD